MGAQDPSIPFRFPAGGPEPATAQGLSIKGNFSLIPSLTISALPDPCPPKCKDNVKAPLDDGLEISENGHLGLDN